MSKHTPGPWKLESGLRVFAPPHGRFGLRSIVARVNGGAIAGGDGDANAALIAAAPRMHAVLGKIITRMEGDPATWGALLDEAAEVWSEAVRRQR